MPIPVVTAAPGVAVQPAALRVGSDPAPIVDAEAAYDHVGNLQPLDPGPQGNRVDPDAGGRAQPAYKVHIDGVADAKDAAMLADACRKLLGDLDDGHLTVSREVVFVNDRRGPMYRSGLVHARFPFHMDTANGRVVKSAKDSVAINLHEVGHQVFDDTVRARYAGSPELIWAFFAQTDMIGWWETHELIDQTKGTTRFRDTATDDILNTFFDYRMVGELYNELFADLTVTVHLRDPDAIFDSIHFPAIARSADRIEADFQQTHRHRRFLETVPMSAAERAMRQDVYAVFSPIKSFIWHEIVEKHPNQSRGALMSEVLDAMVESFRGVTKNFTVPPETITAKQLNDSLRACLQRRFPSH